MDAGPREMLKWSLGCHIAACGEHVRELKALMARLPYLNDFASERIDRQGLPDWTRGSMKEIGDRLIR